MEYLHFDLPYKWVTLYPLGDWHLGSPQCDEHYIRKVVKEIEENKRARWYGAGDLMENAIIGSKSDTYKQILSPKEQIKTIVKILKPIKDKCLFMLPGNHEERTMRAVGLHPDDKIAYELDAPFVEYSCLFVLDLLKARTPRSFSIYAHHNSGGGYTPGGKVNAASKLRLICPTVDATFTAHVHTSARMPVTWIEAGNKQALKKTGYDYIIGSTLTWDKSYAEEKAKRPSTVEHIKVTFVGSTSGDMDRRKQIYEVINK